MVRRVTENEDDRARGYSTEIGIDGSPIDPRHPFNRRAPSTIGEFVERELRRCERAWLAGTIPALADAIAICHRFKCQLPKWAAVGAIQTIENHYKSSATRGMGRLANARAEDRQNEIHYTRWDMVRELRDRRDELKSVYRPTWDAAYENASIALRKTDAAGEPESMKRSYRLVQKAMKSGSGPSFYIRWRRKPG